MDCPLCSGRWEAWELLMASTPQWEMRERVAGWLGQLPSPAVVQIHAGPDGLRLHLFLPPGTSSGIIPAWASLLQQQSRWRQCSARLEMGRVSILHTRQRLPEMAVRLGDPFLSVGGHLLGQAGSGEAVLGMWLMGSEPELRERLRVLSSYPHGTGSAPDSGALNPWGLRLRLFQLTAVLGILSTGVCGGLISAGWVQTLPGFLGGAAGLCLVLAGFLGTLDWLELRAVPQEILERYAREPLLRVAFTIFPAGAVPPQLVSGRIQWKEAETAWPAVRAYTLPLPVADVAALITPPLGEGSGMIASDARQEVPAPLPSLELRSAPFIVGHSVASGENIGIDPDGHGMAIGGSRTGKSSFVFNLLRQLIHQGKDAPGIFLVDPHLSLADGFLQIIDELQGELREEAIRRLRIVTPDQAEVIPLNLLCVPDFSWAGNSIVQIGRRIWEDYWGPRMQAALLGLFKLAHAWNRNRPDQAMGLLHVVFAAFNAEWRHIAMGYLPPMERMGSLALDALLGQMRQEYGGRWDQGWVTEVISPVMSKVMALELSPWLFASLHQSSFVDMERWVREKAWVVLRLPSGTMGREGARLTAGIVYNVFEAAFRKVTLNNPLPTYFLIDEAQEIGSGMRLESMLAEGAKFGAKMFVMSQSLSMMRRVEGFEAVVQAMLANTSTQAFFSPDPEDGDLIRSTLSSTLRYGEMTLDLPSLQCWLRARLGGRWQAPALTRIEPLVRSNPEVVRALIREVIAAHPADYAHGELWQEGAVQTLQAMVPPAYRHLLEPLFMPDLGRWKVEEEGTAGVRRDAAGEPDREGGMQRLGL
jgi:hypothetical protein